MPFPAAAFRGFLPFRERLCYNRCHHSCFLLPQTRGGLPLQALNESAHSPATAARRSMPVMMSPQIIYQFLFSSVLSSALTSLPVLGCALFLNSQVSAMLWRLLWGRDRAFLTRRMRRICLALTVLMLLGTLGMIAVYPMALSSAALWALFAAVATAALRENLCRRLWGRRLRETVSRRAFWGLCLLCHLLSLGLTAWPLLVCLPVNDAALLLCGYGLDALLEGFSHWRNRESIALDELEEAPSPEALQELNAGLNQLNAFNAYRKLQLFILMALQLTLVLAYLFIGLTVDELILCMALACACTLATHAAADAFLRALKREGSVQTLLAGLFLWAYGLILFDRQLELPATSLALSYLALCLCGGGLGVSLTALRHLESSMANVAQFGLEGRMNGYARIRSVGTEMALLLGQMAALGMVTFLCLPRFLSQTLTLESLSMALHRWMIVPPLLLLAIAIVCVLRFPMNNRHFAKLARWLTLKEEGGSNPALREQLENVVVKRHKNRFGVKIIIALLRPLYYHKVVGKENLRGLEDGTMVLVCNHGELYGPVVANLYIPVAFRPWAIAEMMNREVIIEHMYQGTMMRQKWLPESWKRPLLRMITPLLLWVFDSLEAIPVYRNDPRKLIGTFRETIDAMQAGDNILLFPENDTGHAVGERGYASEGVGRLFTGFAMIAPLYYAKTKKKAIFIPVYASRKTRTVRIGQGIEYQPDNGANDEKLRIVDGLLAQMQAMYEEEIKK